MGAGMSHSNTSYSRLATAEQATQPPPARAQAMSVEEPIRGGTADDECWICLSSEPDENGEQPAKACHCPRVSHRSCLAR